MSDTGSGGRELIDGLHGAVGNQVIQRSTRTGAGEASLESAAGTAQPFGVGDAVRTTDNLNIREGPGTDHAVLETTPVGVTGDVIGGPERASGYTWWRIEYDAGYTGWSAQPWLDRTTRADAGESSAAAGATGAGAGPGAESAGSEAAAEATGGKTTTTEYLPPLHYYDKVVTVDYNYPKFGPGEITREVDLPPAHEYDGVYIVQSGSTEKKHYW